MTVEGHLFVDKIEFGTGINVRPSLKFIASQKMKPFESGKSAIARLSFLRCCIRQLGKCIPNLSLNTFETSLQLFD